MNKCGCVQIKFLFTKTGGRLELVLKMYALSQYYPKECFTIMEMFYICTVQYGRCQPHVARATKELNLYILFHFKLFKFKQLQEANSSYTGQCSSGCLAISYSVQRFTNTSDKNHQRANGQCVKLLYYLKYNFHFNMNTQDQSNNTKQTFYSSLEFGLGLWLTCLSTYLNHKGTDAYLC